MKTDIRVCLGRIPGMFFVSKGKIVGPQRAFETFYYENLFRDYNSSIIDKPISGGIIPGSEAADGTFLYTGCLESIQKNESDYLLGSISQPIIGRNLSMGGLYGGATSIIISAYNPQVNPKEINILSSLLSSTPYEIKLLFLSFVLLFCFILYFLFSNETKSRIKLCFSIIFGCLLKQYSCFESCLTEKMISRIRWILFVLVVFTFLFMHYVCSLIKTDQVVFPDPKTITSYQDILDSNGMTVPKFVAVNYDYIKFQMSSEGSKRRQIWNRISRENKIFDPCLLKSKRDILSADFQLLNQTAVIITYSNGMLAWISNLCVIYKMHRKPHNVLVSIDPNESLTLIKSTMKRKISDEEGNVNRFKRVDQVLNSFLEMGLNEKAHEYQAFTMLEGKPFPKKIYTEVRECMSNIVQTPHPEFSSKKITEFESLFLNFFIAIFITIPVHFVEMISKKKVFE